MTDADVTTLHSAAERAAFPRFYVTRTQLPTTTDVLSIPQGPDIALVIDCTSIASPTLGKMVRAFIRELPPNFTVRSAVHATASVYVLTVTRLPTSEQPEPFVPPTQYAPSIRAPTNATPLAPGGGGSSGPVSTTNGHHKRNGNNRRKLVFTDLPQAVKSVEKFVKSTDDVLEHDDETLVDYAVGEPSDGGWDELEVTFHSQRHNVHVTYYVTFDTALNVETFVVSPTHECHACHREWNDAHPEPPV